MKAYLTDSEYVLFDGTDIISNSCGMDINRLGYYEYTVDEKRFIMYIDETLKAKEERDYLQEWKNIVRIIHMTISLTDSILSEQ